MSKKKSCSLKIYDGEKWLHENAAVLFNISHNYDGYDDFVKKVISHASRETLEVMMPMIVEETVRKITHLKLKLVK